MRSRNGCTEAFSHVCVLSFLNFSDCKTFCDGTLDGSRFLTL